MPEEKLKPLTRIEILAGMLDQPAVTPELVNPVKSFSMNLGFWNLCMQARKELKQKA